MGSLTWNLTAQEITKALDQEVINDESSEGEIIIHPPNFGNLNWKRPPTHLYLKKQFGPQRKSNLSALSSFSLLTHF